jgi:hypothetical protein
MMAENRSVIDIGDRKQLFVDEGLVAGSRNVRLTMNPARPTGEVLINIDRPWERTGEESCLGLYNSVLQDDGRIRVWYFVRGDGEDKDQWRICYAESDNGIDFHKPELGLCEVGGSRANNVVIDRPQHGGPSVWIDPNAPPERRYRTQTKVYGEPEIAGKIYFHASPDGIHWEPTHIVDLGDCDTQTIVFWDDRIERYVMYTRLWVRFDDKHRNYRTVRRFESDDLVHWEQEEVVWQADRTDLATYLTHTGQPPVDYYGAYVYKYPDAGDTYVMFAQAYWHWKMRPPEQRWGPSGDPQVAKIQRLAPAAIDARLGVSRDGVAFQRAVDRGPFLALGPDGRFDSRMVWLMPSPAVMGDELWFYYGGTNRDHDGFIDPAAPGLLSGIGRAVLRVDGFVSADAAHTGGWLETPPVTFAGGRLELNLDTSGGGAAQVELLDTQGQPLPGFAREDARPLCGNAVRMPVSWGERADVSALAGQSIRIRFWLQDCKLYAFRFRA